MKDNKDKIVSIVKNKKAYLDYEILSTFEGGIELKGHEVKSIRNKHINLKGAYISNINGGLFVKGMHVSPWKGLPNFQYIEPTRERKVFLKKKDILYLSQKIKESGFSLLVLEVYFKGQLIKVAVGLGKGRKKYEKKQVLKERTLEKEAKIAMHKYY